MTITAKLADGRTLEFPDGTAPEVVQATVKKMIGAAAKPVPKPLPEPEFEKEARRTLETTPAELIAANPMARVAVGAAKPILWGADLLARPFGDTTGRDTLKQLSEMQERGNEALRMGPSGAVADFSGGLLSPVFGAATKAMPSPTTIRESAAQGAKLGALAGVTAPRENDESALTNTAIGAGGGTLLGGVLPIAGRAVKGLYQGLVEPWWNPAAIKGRAYLEAAGEKKDEIIAALLGNREIVRGATPTAGEAAAPAASAEFSALARAAEGKLPTHYGTRADEQNKAMLEAVRSVGKDRRAFERAVELRSDKAKNLYGEVENTLISPRSDAQLMDDAIAARQQGSSRAVEDVRRLSRAGQVAEDLAQSGRMRLDAGAPPAVGLPRVSGRYSYGTELGEIAERKAGDAARASLDLGAERRYLEQFKSLLKEADNLDTTPLAKFLDRPSVQEAVARARRGASESGKYFPERPGEDPFSVGNLQRIKMAIEDVLADPKNVAGIQATERKEVGDTLGGFVNWLSNKSPGWKRARLQYAEDSIPINQMQIGQYLEGILTPQGYQQGAGGMPLNAKGYIEAMRKSTDVANTEAARRAADLITKRATGAPRYGELSEAMTPDQMGRLESVAENLLRRQAFEGLAKRGAETAVGLENLGARGIEQTLGGKLPNLLMREAMITNALISRLERSVGKKLATEMALEMMSPPTVGRAMQDQIARQAHRQALIEAVRQLGSTGAAVGLQQGLSQ